MKKLFLLMLIMLSACYNQKVKIEPSQTCLEKSNLEGGICLKFEYNNYQGVLYPSYMDSVELNKYINYFKKDVSDSLHYRLSTIRVGDNECYSSNGLSCDRMIFNVVKIRPLQIDTLHVWQTNVFFGDENLTYIKIKDEPIKEFVYP